jgi:DNA-binding beta-propeller fold protein YncE
MKLESVPLGLVFSKDGKTAFVSVVQTDGVLKIDTEKFEILGRAETGNAPDGLAYYGN